MATLVVLTGCAAPQSSAGGGQPPSSAPGAPKTLRIALQGQDEQKSGIIAYGAASAFSALEHFLIFHASLSVYDNQGNLAPRLAEKMPSLQDGDWKAFPDGRMEVTWKLKNATWHDGAPLTSEDFALGLAVINDPEVPVSRPGWAKLVSGIETPDAWTLIVKWKELSFQGGGTGTGDVNPLPVHLIGDLYHGDRQLFLNAPYWTDDFIGLGPYKLKQWQRGSHLEGLAFDGYVLGRPKIDRVIVTYVGDVNTVVAGMVSGDLDVVPMGARLDTGQMMAIQTGWGPGGGFAAPGLSSTRTVYWQFRDPTAPWVRDVRVRRALAHATDRQAMSDVLQYGLSPPADTSIPPSEAAFKVLEARGFAKYRFDIPRALQLFAEAGWTPGPDKVLRDAGGQALTLDISATGQGSNVQEIEALASQWRDAGVQASPVPLPPPAANLDELKNTVKGGIVWPGIGFTAPLALTTQQVASERTVWKGSNYGGYSNPEYDQLYDKLIGTLELSARQRVLADLMALVADQVPAMPVFYYGNVVLARKEVTGVSMNSPNQMATAGDIHLWEIK